MLSGALVYSTSVGTSTAIFSSVAAVLIGLLTAIAIVAGIIFASPLRSYGMLRPVVNPRLPDLLMPWAAMHY